MSRKLGREDFSRRRFLKATAAVASTVPLGALLSACGGEASTTVVDPKHRGNITSSVMSWVSPPKGEGDLTKNWAVDWINKNGPTNVKYVVVDNEDKIGTLMAAGSEPDLIWSYWTDWRNLQISGKRVNPIEDVIDKYSTTYKGWLQKHEVLKKASVLADGHIYQFAKLRPFAPGHAFLVRTDWLKKLDLQAPTTADEVLTVARAFKKNMDQLGGKGGYSMGLCTAEALGYVVDDMFQNVNWYVNSSTGQLEHAWDQLAAAFEFKKTLYSEGLIIPSFLSDPQGSAQYDLWNSGKIGMMGSGLGGLSSADVQGYTEWKQNTKGGTYDAIPLPKTTFGQFSPAIQPPFQFVSFMGKRAKDPQAVMQYIDFLAGSEAQSVLGNGGYPYKKDANGCVVPNNDPKVSYTWIYNWLTGAFAGSQCFTPGYGYDARNADAQEYKTMYDHAVSAYLSPERPLPWVTWVEYYPPYPANLAIIEKTLLDPTTGQVTNLVNKAIVTRSSTTTETINEAKNLWKSAGGEQLDQWWADWYQKNKDTYIMTADLYKTKPLETLS